MPTDTEWREILRDHHLSEEQFQEFLSSLRAWLGQFLDDYFREEVEEEQK
jgi:hypothetical protein